VTEEHSFDRLRAIAGDVSRETYERLLEFERAFRRWSQRINLAAPSTLDSLWERHILDSAQLIRLAPDALRWLDLGSGGGFPGAVIAVLLNERPGAAIALVESNRKKASFLQTTLSALGTTAEIHACRIEDARISFAPQIVTARALAPLDRLIGLAMPWLSTGARALFHKGRDYRSEIEESTQLWSFDLIEHQSAIDSHSVILEIADPMPVVGRTD
jgi:16S rRNA (guanine527-N7)-methyltransferase